MKKNAVRLLLLVALLAVTACGNPAPFHHEYASGHYTSDIEQCAPYARDVTGVPFHGDAYSWWDQAAALHYHRGHGPANGAILVLRRTSRLHSGHVAVVKDIISSREIDVTHSNWGNTRRSRHIVYDSMRVRDVSANNDWSSLRFWNDEKNVFGIPYAAYGFIYP